MCNNHNTEVGFCYEECFLWGSLCTQILSWETDSPLIVPRILCTLKVHCRVSTQPTSSLYLEQFERSPQPRLNVFLIIRFIIILPSTSGFNYTQVSQMIFSLPIFQQQFSIHISLLPCLVHFFSYVSKMKAWWENGVGASICL
jgi:hypothetical protein